MVEVVLGVVVESCGVVVRIVLANGVERLYLRVCFAV